MAQSQATKPLSKAGIAFFSSLCATTFGLGCWQAQRYYEKIDMIEARNQESLMEPQALEKNAKCSIAEQQGVREDKITQRGFGPITVQGEFAHQYEILIGPRGPPPGAISSSGPNSGRSSGGMSSSPQGYYVITPLKRNFGMGTVLVNRGWVPRQYVLQNAAWDRPNGTVNIVGVASKTEQPKYLSPAHDENDASMQLIWMDRKAIEHKTQTAGLSPLLITEAIQLSSSSATKNNENSIPVKPLIDAIGEFKVMPPTHAGYAFTWFGLSAAGTMMTKKLISRGRA